MKEKKKVIPVLLIKYHAVRTYRDVGVKLYAILTTSLSGYEWSASRLFRFILEQPSR
jgi:hypothetical protein